MHIRSLHWGNHTKKNTLIKKMYRQVVDDPVVVVLFLDDGLERLHVVRLEVLHAQNVAKLVLLHEQLPKIGRVHIGDEP